MILDKNNEGKEWLATNKKSTHDNLKVNDEKLNHLKFNPNNL